ncbi:hypothetical protein DCD74_05645 [Lysobacter oculi]|uniref:DUF4177 domain-containing protein n=1 Tax=Solilutibacter oculi TaxID=2698682 RepID=A0A344J5D8_9GAMM|nr:DUF4177 domain-containing protein [Lysobacter oculi]AXA84248.1 hypothetical protein DCD74_05645 [Lysobacter oculi]
MSARWEYNIVNMPTNMWGTFNEKKLAEQFALLGRQGWELVSFNANPMTGTPLAIFKRPVA